MVNFKLRLKQLEDKLTPEQRKQKEEYKVLCERNTFFKKEIPLFRIVGENKIDKGNIEVCLYRNVNIKTLDIDEKILLSFGFPMEYSFDKKFIKLFEGQPAQDQDRLFYIDAGYGLAVEFRSMIELINECFEILKQKEIEIVDDYYPTVSEMLDEIYKK